MIRGLDVSAVQGPIDWQSVATLGCRFAIIKCSEGNKPSPDPYFERNVKGARDAGLVVGAYHFAYPLPPDASQPGRDPVAQARHAFDLAGGLGSNVGDLPPSFDFEWPPPDQWAKWGCSAEQLRAWGVACLEAMTALFRCRPLCYTYPDFWMHVDGGAEAKFAAYPLWMASYPHPRVWPGDQDKPLIVKPWTSWTCWQFTGGSMTLPNGTAVDFDVMPSEGVLQALIGDRAPAPDTASAASAGIEQAANELDPGPPTAPGDLPDPA